MTKKEEENPLEKTYGVMIENKRSANPEDLKYFQEKALEFGSSRIISINPTEDIIFEERVKLVCVNNCFHYGDKLSCPPYIPQIDYEKAIKEYETGLFAIVHATFEDEAGFQKVRKKITNKLHQILLKLEKEAFEKGYSLSTSFIGGSCKLCDDCPPKCQKPLLSRIPIGATGVNVVETMKKYDTDLRFPVEHYGELKRIGLLLLGK